jgi:membrane protein YqaA with SNARE-associated domain
MDAWLQTLLQWLALPEVGLSTVFVVSLVSATLLPMASVPAVYALVALEPALFWPAIAVATAGNTVGGAISYWMGLGAEAAVEKLTHRQPPDARALGWLRRCLPAFLAALRGRPLVRRGRLAAPAFLALRSLHGGGQVCALSAVRGRTGLGLATAVRSELSQ